MPELLYIYVDEIDREIAYLKYPDGTIFTTTDWQGEQPTTLKECADFDWMEFPSCRHATIINGLPHLLD